MLQHEPIHLAPELTKRQRDELIRGHMLVAQSEARRARRRWRTLDSDDLHGVAMLALVNAAQRHNPTLGDFGPRVRFLVRGALSDHAEREFRVRNKTAMLTDTEEDTSTTEALAAVERRIDMERALDLETFSLAEMRISGMTLREVGDAVGCDASTVYRKLERAKVGVKK